MVHNVCSKLNKAKCAMQIVNVLGFRMPYYKSPTLLLSLGLSIRVFWHLIMTRPDVIHVSSPGVMVFAGILYAKILDLPLVVSYHTHIPGQALDNICTAHLHLGVSAHCD